MALTGIRCIEIAGLAPAPFAGLCLADFGASVVRVDRATNGRVPGTADTLGRGKRSIALDLKSDGGVKTFKELIRQSDVLIEPFRPGVMERLGLGPSVLCELNPQLIYARMTGFGQGGSANVEKAAGHDINYIAQSGVLSALRKAGEKPMPPANLLGDFGGGGLICAFGILLGLMERQKSNKGQVVDAAMVDGASYLASVIIKGSQLGAWNNGLDEVGTNMLDGGAPFYDTYTCKDGRFFSVGAIEKQFYAELLAGLELNPDDLPHQMDRDQWPAVKAKFAEVFMTKTRDEWAQLFKGKDACAFPILDINEAIHDEHNQKRGTFAPNAMNPDIYDAAAAPKLSRTPARAPAKDPFPGQDSIEILKEFHFADDQIKQLLDSGAVVSTAQSKI